MDVAIFRFVEGLGALGAAHRLELESERYQLQESGRYLLQDSLRAFGAEVLELEGADQQTELRRPLSYAAPSSVLH
nr:hypothetical protein [Armatimonas sp.]